MMNRKFYMSYLKITSIWSTKFILINFRNIAKSFSLKLRLQILIIKSTYTNNIPVNR